MRLLIEKEIILKRYGKRNNEQRQGEEKEKIKFKTEIKQGKELAKWNKKSGGRV